MKTLKIFKQRNDNRLQRIVMEIKTMPDFKAKKVIKTK